MLKGPNMIHNSQVSTLSASSANQAPESGGADGSVQVIKSRNLLNPGGKAFYPLPQQLHRQPGPRPRLSPPKSTYPITLNSSPLKRTPTRISTRDNSLLSSSPTRRVRKLVAFSDDLVSESPSPPHHRTPQKSILKTSPEVTPPGFTKHHTDPEMWARSGCGPDRAAFWEQGIVIQLPRQSPFLEVLIQGCVQVLLVRKFQRRFEVYATINDCIKTLQVEATRALIYGGTGVEMVGSPSPRFSSTAANNLRICYKNSVPELTKTICQDVGVFSSDARNSSLSASKPDAFETRTTSQALKLMSTILLDAELSKFVPVPFLKSLLNKACKVLLHPDSTRALMFPYLQLFKDFKNCISRRPNVFESSKLPENILKSLIGLETFSSSRMMTERYYCFKSLVVSFPGIMAKNFHHWFGVLVFSICTLASHSYTKCLGPAINCLLEISKAYLDNSQIQLEVRSFLMAPVSPNLSHLLTKEGESTSVPTGSILGAIKAWLESLIRLGEYRPAMDIWVAFSLLIGDKQTGFDQWEGIDEWMSVPQYCFQNKAGVEGQLCALSTSRAVIFNLCRDNFEGWRRVAGPCAPEEPESPSLVKSKARLLHWAFFAKDIENCDQQVKEILNGTFRRLLLHVVHLSSRSSSLQYYWDVLIQPLFMKYYLRGSCQQLHRQAYETLRLLLATGSFPVDNHNNQSFSDLRILSDSPILDSEIKPLMYRSILQFSTGLMQVLIKITFSDHISSIDKIGLIVDFLNKVKMALLKEGDFCAKSLMSTLPMLMRLRVCISSGGQIHLDLCIKLLTFIMRTFTSEVLTLSTGEQRSALAIIISDYIRVLSIDQVCQMVDIVVKRFDTAEILSLSVELMECHPQKADIESLMVPYLAKRQFKSDEYQILLCGKLCRHLTTGFEVFVKSFLQCVVALKNPIEMRRFLVMLKVESWSLPTFKYFALLVHNAPNAIVREISYRALLMKFSIELAFVDLLEYLAVNGCFQEIHQAREIVLSRYSELKGVAREQFTLVWKQVLFLTVSPQPPPQLLDDILAATTKFSDIDVDKITPQGTSISEPSSSASGFSKSDLSAIAVGAHESSRLAKNSEMAPPPSAGQQQSVKAKESRGRTMTQQESSEAEGSNRAPLDLGTPSKRKKRCVGLKRLEFSTQVSSSSSRPYLRARTSPDRHSSPPPMLPQISNNFDLNAYTSMVGQQLRLRSISNDHTDHAIACPLKRNRNEPQACRRRASVKASQENSISGKAFPTELRLPRSRVQEGIDAAHCNLQIPDLCANDTSKVRPECSRTSQCREKIELIQTESVISSISSTLPTPSNSRADDQKATGNALSKESTRNMRTRILDLIDAEVTTCQPTISNESSFVAYNSTPLPSAECRNNSCFVDLRTNNDRPLDVMVRLMSSTLEHDLSELTRDARFELETKLMKFMLRVRSVNTHN